MEECHPARGHLFEGAGLFATCNQFSTVLTNVIDFILRVIFRVGGRF